MTWAQRGHSLLTFWSSSAFVLFSRKNSWYPQFGNRSTICSSDTYSLDGGTKGTDNLRESEDERRNTRWVGTDASALRHSQYQCKKTIRMPQGEPGCHEASPIMADDNLFGAG